MTDIPEGWEARGKPPALFRRFSFERYSETRDFLDAMAALSEEAGLHPQNINFAINGAVAKLFLDSQGVEYETGPSSKKVEPAEIGAAAKKFTLLVECYR